MWPVKYYSLLVKETKNKYQICLILQEKIIIPVILECIFVDKMTLSTSYECTT